MSEPGFIIWPAPIGYHPVQWKLLHLKDGAVLELRFADGDRRELCMSGEELGKLAAALSAGESAGGMIGQAAG